MNVSQIMDVHVCIQVLMQLRKGGVCVIRAENKLLYLNDTNTPFSLLLTVTDGRKIL